MRGIPHCPRGHLRSIVCPLRIAADPIGRRGKRSALGLFPRLFLEPIRAMMCAENEARSSLWGRYRGASLTNRMDKTPIRVLVADDNAVVRDDIVTILNAGSEIRIVGEAGDGAEALRK